MGSNKAFDLGAVLAGAATAPEAGEKRIKYLDIDLIKPDPGNFYAMTGIEDLAANIATVGLLDPLVVRRDPDAEGEYIVVSGHRRRAALALLVAEDKREDLRMVPCLVASDEEPAAMLRLQLISANCYTRELSGYEKSEQIKEVTRLLYELKELHGVEFPGRMRDHVAEAVNATRGDLSRLKVTREGLIGPYMDLWKKGKLLDSPAYELARCKPETQKRLYEALKTKIPTAKRIEELREAIEKGHHSYRTTMCCPGTNKPCTHCDAALRHDADSWDKCFGEKCCMNCKSGGNRGLDSWHTSCSSMCSKAAAKVARRRAHEKARDEERARRELSERELSIQLSAMRYATAMERAGVDKLGVGTYFSAASKEKVKAWADGDFSDRVDLPIYCTSLLPRAVGDLVKQVEALGCSADYLLGLSDQMQAGAAMPDGWVPLEWIDAVRSPVPPEGQRDRPYYCEFDCGGTIIRDVAEWSSLGYWVFPGNQAKIDAKCLRYFPLPMAEGEP